MSHDSDLVRLLRSLSADYGPNWSGRKMRTEAADRIEATQWRPIESAPKDGTLVLVYCPPYAGLSSIRCTAEYHTDAGWCVDELRTVTHWLPLPSAPETPDAG